MANISQRVIFTVIPNGFSGARARFNLHISPRLTLAADAAPADLSQFPAWRDWARTINAAKLTLLVNGKGYTPERTASADPAVWRAVFPPGTPVQTHVFEDLRDHDVLTYPLAELARSIEADYVSLAATASDDLPEVAELEKRVRYAPGREHTRSSLIELLRDSKSVEAVRNREVAVALLAEYHRPLNQEEIFTAKKAGPDDPHEDTKYRAHPRVAMPTPAELAVQFDFHGIVSALGQHPVLMAACGLVIPLEVDISAIPAGDIELQIAVEWDQGGVPTEPDVLPVTLARLDAEDFRARPRDPAYLAGGLLRMDSGQFELVAMDVDGAGLGLKNLSLNLPRMANERFDDENFDIHQPARAGAPRLRTAGLQLAQTRRDRAIRGLFEGSHALNEAADAEDKVTLYAEDLIRGWRADVHDLQTGRWQSLLRFDGRYELLAAGEVLATKDEETTLRLAAGKAADGSNSKLLKASEALFAWSGWSLAAPQPGLAVMPDDISHDVPPNEAPSGLPLRVTPTATPGSLPLLRFGRTYRVRMRYADLAGGGVAWSPDSEPSVGTATLPYRFGRYEPVESPSITLINGDPPPKDGESMGRAALRTMDDVSDNDVEARRNLVPPRVGIRFAELHGALDRDGRPNPGAYDLLAGRDANYPEVTVDTPAFQPVGAKAVTVKTSFATGPEASSTPYLYDPLAGGVALRITGVPGIDPAKIWRVPFYGDAWDPDANLKWPEALGFSLTASEAGITGWEPASRTFRVALAPGERARVQISALIPTGGVAQFKLLDRLRELAKSKPQTSEAYKRALARVLAGQHWMFTPSRTVELVHALQRPLVTPRFLNLSAGRQAGQIKASVGYATPIHCKSTVRLDMQSHWVEIDDHGADGPVTGTRDAQAFRRNFARLDNPDIAAKRLVDEQIFADTRARWVNYRMTATTRFREFMPEEVRKDARLLSRESDDAAVWIPSSAPPAAPVISYVVPTFGWFDSGAPGQDQRTWREGGGLRVYLERPWFGSGSNEMLAVLLPTGSDDPSETAGKDFVTQWGADPIWAGPKVKTIAPARGAFPKRLDKGPIPYNFGVEGATDAAAIAEGAAAGDTFPLENLTPQGAPVGLRVNAVPHAVAYDPDRKLWYCDIVVRPGAAYFPFIRLALARYQPHSVDGLELSSVAMAAFQQLAPDRVATLSPVAGSLGARRVAVYGALPTEGFVRPSAGHISLRLQRLAPGGDPDLDWRDTDEGQRPSIGDLPLIVSFPRTTSSYNLPRSTLSPLQEATATDALNLVAAGRLGDVVARPDFLEVMLPPLIHEQVIQLPAANGDQLRLLVVETEAYSIESDSGLRSPGERERIVYAATIDL